MKVNENTPKDNKFCTISQIIKDLQMIKDECGDLPVMIGFIDDNDGEMTMSMITMASCVELKGRADGRVCIITDTFPNIFEQYFARSENHEVMDKVYITFYPMELRQDPGDEFWYCVKEVPDLESRTLPNGGIKCDISFIDNLRAIKEKESFDSIASIIREDESSIRFIFKSKIDTPFRIAFTRVRK